MKKHDTSLNGKTLLVVNTGSPKKRFIFQRLKKLGIRVVVINKEKNWAQPYVDEWILTDTYDRLAAVDAVRVWVNASKSNRFDGITTYWEDDVPLAARLCAEFKMMGNSLEAANITRDKYRMQERLKQCGFNFIDQRLLKTEKQLEEAMKHIGFPAVMKPVAGSDSQFVLRVDDEQHARDAFSYLRRNCNAAYDPIFQFNRHFLYQKFIEGPEFSMECYCQHGVPHIVGVHEKTIMKPPFFMETGDYCPPRIDEEELGELNDAVKNALIVFDIQNSLAHAEIKLTDDGPMIIEIASRMGGDYTYDNVLSAYGFDMVDASAYIALGQNVKQKAKETGKCIVSHFFIPEHSGIIAKFRGKDELKKAGFSSSFSKSIGDSVFVPPAGYENVGWITSVASSFASAEKNLSNILGKVAIEVTPFRSTSSIGRTKRRGRTGAASLANTHSRQGAKIEKIRTLPRRSLRKLHVGIACNVYQSNGANAVEADLMSVGRNIENTLIERGYKVTFIDFNDVPKAIEQLASEGIDIVFNVCERINDSSLLEPHAASILDIMQIPYTGSNPFTLGLCIDKIRVKKLLAFHDIPTPRWDYAYAMDDAISDDLRYPLIVKPANTDNSIGITNNSVVTNTKELQRQMEEVIVQLGSPALVEEYIEGDEYDVSIIGNDEEDLKVLPLSRSIFTAMPEGYWHIYPFDAKWTEEDAYERIVIDRPAKIPGRLASLISEVALDTYNILDCHDYGRVEIRTDAEGNPYVLELNPNPSISIGDCVPNCAKLLGMDYGDFLEEIMRMTIRRYKDRPPYYHLQTSIL
ncbi:hypothetical protein COU78_01340 [Candidatus Peregrinibacteria bacterium CG10_big_fil_rev_8_21_14_0_10_49_24]|nr:MAG: hypothetical protein COV83_04305 [Candidatus Peregrinibacteria bacterium CG11_big_fil_rev_8_21_14_0_20_49_14]PIR51369.1 MAG: hypothetical protein COU78_01340 [Candidatus Peregrinibacteria bacterium CG10_big_fil_rev_8_21_14_0_10_49_24]PJA68133.1 MAG: hypothetical protein CO157_01155 [Candidatus Peregrinibacteria bacterium CG_4_9_14_3_um_filter_49_12]